MPKEIRTVIYDTALHIEAYHFQGIMQKFPNHFHEYYVIGFIEKGKRHLSCCNMDYTIEPGDLMLFNPRVTHTCEQIDSRTLDYRCINILPEIMKRAVFEITGKAFLPGFRVPVVFHCDLVLVLRELHRMIMRCEKDFKREELFFLLLEQLLEEYTEQNLPVRDVNQDTAVGKAAAYLEKNYDHTITLDELSRVAGLSKYYLLRSFTRERGISPYSYLETIRIDRAKKMLAGGVRPSDAAVQTGFTDQSHFSHFFKKFIGLTPKQYMKIFKEPVIKAPGHQVRDDVLNGQEQVEQHEQ